MTAMTDAERTRRYRERHGEELLAKRPQYNAARREARRVAAKVVSPAQMEELAEKRKRWYRANLEHNRARTREYARTHSEQMAAQKKLWRATAAGRASANAAKNRRKALLRGNQSERYSRLAVYERDKGKCHICGGRVGVMEFTLDHLVPVSEGGADAAWNVAVAHHRCNSARGPGRLPAQLMFRGGAE